MNPHNALQRLMEADHVIPDPGAGGTIKSDRQFAVCELTTVAAEARTLADPEFPGQRLSLVLRVDGGDATVTADSPINQTGNNTIVAGDAGDSIHLVGIRDGDDLEWRVLMNDGTALSTV